MTPAFLDELTAKLKAVIESSPLPDLDKNLRAMVTAAFAKMDLVTREEFDIQSRVLATAREHLAALEAKVAALEQAALERERG